MFFGDIMSFINRFIWLFCTSFILVGGLFYTFKFKGLQFRFLSIIKSVFSGNSFGVLMTSLAGRIGVGSIAGVSLSIYIGGVGSIFWMWISTFFCSIITYMEVVLGVKYKVWKGDISYGGPSYYIRDGLNNRFLGGLYSILIIVSYIGCFLSIQSNTIAKSLVSILPFSVSVIAFCICVVTFFCISGGFKKIVNVSMKLVPVMSLIYIGSSIVVLFLNYDKIGSVFFSVLKSAFNFKSFFSGFIPMFIVGIQRGIFSNEAGIGTSSIVCSSSDSDDYKTLGYTQMFGVYVTTFIFCTATAIIILFSDYGSLVLNDINGIEIASYAFNYHFGSIGTYILLISIILFSFSTIITGYYYGESSFNYFFSKLDIKYVYILRGITLVILFLGCIVSSGLLWDIVDILVGIVVLINLFAIWKLKDDV